MSAHQVERAARAYLTAVTGALVTQDGDEITDDDGFYLVASPQGLPGYQSDGGRGILVDGSGVPLDGGVQFRFYLGENNTDIIRPCGIVSAQTGDGDPDTGNETVELSVSIQVPPAPYVAANDPAATNPLATALEISEACYNALMRSDVCDYLNLYRADAERLTVIGFTARSSAKGVDGEHVFHQINLTLYCAAMNLDPTLPIQS